MRETNSLKMIPIEWAENRLKRNLSPSTVAEYERVWLRLGNTRQGLSHNGRTRSVERSAIRFKLAKTIVAKRDDPVAVAKNWEFVTKLDDAALEAKTAYKQGRATGMPQQRHSKRRSLRGLPSNWREQLTSAAAGSKYCEQIAIMAVSGCRPAELVKGVDVRFENGDVVIRIAGAKVSEHTSGGQLWRELRVDVRHPLVAKLVSGSYDVPKARAIEDSIEHFGRYLWPRRAEPVSAYSLRHAAASDFKSSGRDVREIAAALGHQSTATLQRYGSANRRGGGLTLNGATAASPIREPKTGATAKPALRSRSHPEPVSPKF